MIRVTRTPPAASVRLIAKTLILSLSTLAIIFCACRKNNDTFVLPTHPVVLDPRDSTRVLVDAGYAVLGDFPAGWGNYNLPSGQDTSWVDSFYIDRYEVSNQKYAAFLNSAMEQGIVHRINEDVYDSAAHLLIKTSSADSRIVYVDSIASFAPKLGSETTPVILVSWYGANLFADFNNQRLPSDLEWEKAARGVSGAFGSLFGVGFGYPYPWGDAEPNLDLANFGKQPGQGAPQPVSSYPQGMSWYGAFNMAGNVMEWTATSSGSTKVLRGGSYLSEATDLRTAMRFYFDPSVTFTSYGFRCVSDP